MNARRAMPLQSVHLNQLDECSTCACGASSM